MMVRFYTKGWFDIWNPPCYKVIVLEREKKSPVSCLKSRCGVFVFPKGENMNKQAEKILLTKEGNNKLKEEYRELTEVRRHEIAEKIQDAREMGDLSENASYQTAKEEQAFIEGRIAELEEIFRNSTVVESNGGNGKVSIGSKVKVHIEGDEQTFWIVGSQEADPGSGKISHESPIGMALIGKEVGDEIEVEAPVGKIIYKVLKVE